MDYTTFQYIAWAWIALAVITFLGLFKIIAPFGRHTSDKFGPTVNNNLGWMIMEIPSLATLSFFFFTGSAEPGVVAWILYGLWALHYTNRSFIYPFRQRNKKKRMPLLIVGSAVFFNLVNGFLNGYYLGNFADYASGWMMTVPFVAGAVLFVAGMVTNIWSDNKLLNLRKPGETGYKIPKGGLFNVISCPNLFGEMIEWSGYALMAWNPAALSFAVWTWANLLPRALAHHDWYQEKFPDYPEQRKAAIPFIL